MDANWTALATGRGATASPDVTLPKLNVALVPSTKPYSRCRASA